MRFLGPVVPRRLRTAIEVADPAESLILDSLCGSFEPVIDEVFAADYQDIVEAARRRHVGATDSD